jgi:hypothetical protein
MNSLVEALPGARHVSPLPPYRLEVELRSGETVFLDLAKSHLSHVQFMNNHSLQKIPCPEHFSTIMKY